MKTITGFVAFVATWIIGAELMRSMNLSDEWQMCFGAVWVQVCGIVAIIAKYPWFKEEMEARRREREGGQK